MIAKRCVVLMALVLGLIAWGCGSDTLADTLTTPDGIFAKAVFGSFQKNDSTKFVSLLVAPGDVDDIVESALSSAEKSLGAETAETKFVDIAGKMRKFGRFMFDDVRKKADATGINWSTASVDRVVKRERDGMTRILASISSSGSKYTMQISDVRKIGRGYVIVGGVGFGKSRSRR